MVNVCFCLSAVVRTRILVKWLDKGAGMARKVRDRELGDRASRAKLKPRGKPYWRTLDQGVHIGYRKNPTAGGKWVGRVYRKGAAAPYLTHTLPGVADDKADADNKTVFSFYQAQDQVRAWVAASHRRLRNSASSLSAIFKTWLRQPWQPPGAAKRSKNGAALPPRVCGRS